MLRFICIFLLCISCTKNQNSFDNQLVFQEIRITLYRNNDRHSIYFNLEIPKNFTNFNSYNLSEMELKQYKEKIFKIALDKVATNKDTFSHVYDLDNELIGEFKTNNLVNGEMFDPFEVKDFINQNLLDYSIKNGYYPIVQLTDRVRYVVVKKTDPKE